MCVCVCLANRFLLVLQKGCMIFIHLLCREAGLKPQSNAYRDRLSGVEGKCASEQVFPSRPYVFIADVLDSE